MYLIRRLITVLLSGGLSYFVFLKLYDEFYSYLPPYERLHNINNNGTSILKENSNTLRELYNHALEQSILYAGIIFVVVILLSEFIFWNYTRSKNN